MVRFPQLLFCVLLFLTHAGCAQHLILVKRNNPDKKRLVVPSDIQVTMLSGKKYQLEDIQLSENAIVSGNDTLALNYIKRINCKTKVQLAQNVTGYTMSAAGAFFTFSGLVGLAIASSSGDSYLFPDEQPTGPPLAMMAGGIALGIIGYQVTGMKRSFNLATTWQLKVDSDQN